jgi:glycosyltransferase involved in cell wall biosynthesis
MPLLTGASSVVSPHKPIKVLHVLAPMSEGGLERVVTMLALGQKAEGAQVAAVVDQTEASSHAFVRRLASLEIPVTVVAVPPRHYYAEYAELRGLLDRLQPDIVHTHGSRADIVGGLAARRGGTKHVSTVHGFTGGGLRNRLYEFLQRWALRSADGVIAVSSPLVERLASAGLARQRIHLVPNGYLAAGKLLERRAARDLLSLPADTPIIGWVGRLSLEKGADVMIEALALSDQSWRLSIIGDGPQSDVLRARARDLGVANRISWHGSVADAALLLRAFDVFVLSSRTEGTPIILFEAMHAGIPIVATSVGGVPDVISAAHAVLVPPENPRLIADAIDHIRVDQNAALQRSARALQRVTDAYGHARWIASTRAVYETVLR